MAHSHRWLMVTLLLGLASVLALPGCESDRTRVLLSRTTPAPTPSTARAVPADSPTAVPSASRTALPTSTATRVPTARPTLTPTTAPGRAVTPVLPPPTATGRAVPAATVAPPPAPTATPAPRATATPVRVHVVVYGETLATIARRYGTTVTAIARLNNLTNINRIYPGQRLLIP